MSMSDVLLERWRCVCTGNELVCASIDYRHALNVHERVLTIDRRLRSDIALSPELQRAFGCARQWLRARTRTLRRQVTLELLKMIQSGCSCTSTTTTAVLPAALVRLEETRLAPAERLLEELDTFFTQAELQLICVSERCVRGNGVAHNRTSAGDKLRALVAENELLHFSVERRAGSDLKLLQVLVLGPGQPPILVNAAADDDAVIGAWSTFRGVVRLQPNPAAEPPTYFLALKLKALRNGAAPLSPPSTALIESMLHRISDNLRTHLMPIVGSVLRCLSWANHKRLYSRGGHRLELRPLKRVKPS